MTGVVSEYFGLTQIDVSSGAVTVNNAGNTLPTPGTVDLPVANVIDLEAFEGMLVTFVDTLSASEYFRLGRFGEVVLYEGERPYQFTHANAPDADGFAAYQADLDYCFASVNDRASHAEPDIVGLNEIENDADGITSLSALVGALNTECGPYDFVNAGAIGTDAIKVALLFKITTVTAEDEHFIVDNDVDPNYRDDKNRPTLIQTFQEIATGERVIVAVHHLKSKGSDCDALGDPDLLDGQGNCSQTRAAAAAIVADYIDTTVIPVAGTDRVLAIGDLNAYKFARRLSLSRGAAGDSCKRCGGRHECR